MTDLETKKPLELLQCHSEIIGELKRRKIVRTDNNPIGDYTEWLVCQCLNLRIENNSKAGFDATDTVGLRYQIKGRRSATRSIQFSAIRNLDRLHFDFVIAVAFNLDFTVRFAVKLTPTSVMRVSTYKKHVNAHVLILTDKHIGSDGVEDITKVFHSYLS